MKGADRQRQRHREIEGSMGSGSPWVAWVTRVGGNCARPIKILHNLILAALTASCRPVGSGKPRRRRGSGASGRPMRGRNGNDKLRPPRCV